MKKLISILSSVFILSAAIVLFLMSGVRDLRLAGNTYYVAANGSDANPGTVLSPFQTIQRCASVAHAGDTCLIRAGTYRETVTPNSGITIAPFNNESVTVSGADVVTGWQSHSGPIYKSSGLTWDMGVNRNQVFVDGQMMILARWPNTSLDVSHPEWAEADGGSPQDGNGLDVPWVIDDAELDQPNGFWDGAVVSHLANNGYSQSGEVTSSSRGRVEFRSFHGNQSRGGIQRGTRYFLANKLGALDTGGEWFLDGTLYLWTPSGDNPSNHTVEAKRRMFAFDLNGKSNVTIRGLNIFAASIDLNPSSSNNLLDGIQAKYVWHQARVAAGTDGDEQGDAKWGAWNTGIRLAGHDNVLQNCEIAYSSGNGVSVRGHNQKVHNCTIHDVAYVKVEGGAVSWMGEYVTGADTSGHEVTNNTLHTSGRYLVNHYYAPNIKISYNEMYDFCIQVTDCGATYTNKGGSGGEIAYNIIHGNRGLYLQFGVYLDQWSENYTVHHNVVWDVPGAGLRGGGGCHCYTVFYNNTVWRSHGWVGTSISVDGTDVRAWNNLTDGGVDAGTDLQNNLQTSDPGFVNASGGDFHLRSGSPAIDGGRTIAGLTDGYVGSAPDIGAYEFGGADWTAGASGRPSGTPVFRKNILYCR